jgi:hypothetical protein
MREVDLSHDLNARHREVLRAMGHISKTIGVDDWCLVGGLMVLVASRAAGGRIRRAEGTKDGDILVDVCARPNALEQVVHILTTFGFKMDPPFPGQENARCTFSGYNGQIDVLCPNDAPEGSLETSGGAVSLAIPGGRRALEVAEPIRITYDDASLDIELRVPMIPWAIVVKAANVVHPATSTQDRHIQDVVGMLEIVASSPPESNPLTTADRTLLDQLRLRLSDDADPAWQGMSTQDVTNARAGLRLLQLDHENPG